MNKQKRYKLIYSNHTITCFSKKDIEYYKNYVKNVLGVSEEPIVEKCLKGEK